MRALKILYTLLICAAFAPLQAQVSTDPAEEIDPTQPLTIYVDLQKLDQSNEHTQLLIEAAENDEDIYIYTWLPYEFPLGHPKANGVADPVWKNGNDTLIMTKESDYVYSWTIIPTEWYEVEASAVYESDIHFLVKPKDGGGYGDPDIKSEDLMVAIDPPKLDRDPAYIFPEEGQQDDIYTIYYENGREDKESMQGLAEGEVYLYAEALLSDSTVTRIAPFLFSVGQYPQLEMNYIGDNSFRKFIVPRQFFMVPEELDILNMEFVVLKKLYATSADRSNSIIEAELGCQ